MSRSQYYPFWKAPAGIWRMRLVFGGLGIFLLSIFFITSWQAATSHAFTVYKLHPSGAPFSGTLDYCSDPHWVYWGFFVFYAGLCFFGGSFCLFVAYAATFRAVIPGYWKKRKSSMSAREQSTQSPNQRMQRTPTRRSPHISK
jgi:hypothetical protein